MDGSIVVQLPALNMLKLHCQVPRTVTLEFLFPLRNTSYHWPPSMVRSVGIGRNGTVVPTTIPTSDLRETNRHRPSTGRRNAGARMPSLSITFHAGTHRLPIKSPSFEPTRNFEIRGIPLKHCMSYRHCLSFIPMIDIRILFS